MPGFCKHCGGTVGTPGKVHQLCMLAELDADEASDPGGLQVPVTPPTHDELVAYAAERGHLVPTWPEETPPVQFQLSPDDIRDLRAIFPRGLQSAPGRVFRNEECVLNEAIVCLSVYEDGHRSRERVRLVSWTRDEGYAEVEMDTDSAEDSVGRYPYLGGPPARTPTLGGTPEVDTDQETMRQAMAKAEAEAKHPMIPNYDEVISIPPIPSSRPGRRSRLVGHGWAWEFEGGVCSWAHSAQEQLSAESKPGDGAKPIFVAIVPMDRWREARAALAQVRGEPKPMTPFIGHKYDWEAAEPTPTADVDTDTSGCLFAGPGRGDCEHAVGLPGEDRDVDHDGPRTEDAYGRPNGWCWSCWKSYRIASLEREAMAKDHHATLDTSPIDVVD